MEITKKQLVGDMRKIGVQEGDHIAIGASLKSLGPIEGGPDGFIDALLEAIGPEGTIMVNTYTRYFLPAEVRLGWTDYLFEAGTTKCYTGIVSETMRLREGAIRSKHPTMSHAAIGKKAYYLLNGHDETAESYLPYARLAEIDGKYLAVGIGDHLKGLRHWAQHQAGLLGIVPWKRSVRYVDKRGEPSTFILEDRGGCTRRLPELVDDLRAKHLVMEGMVGMARSLLVPAKESLSIMTNLLANDPARNLCDKTWCYWCRELERRLRLYHNLKEPKLFQRNWLMIHLVSLANKIRELDNAIIAGLKITSAKMKRKH